MVVKKRYDKVSGIECESLPDFEVDTSRNIWSCKIRFMKDTLGGSEYDHETVLVNMVDVRADSQLILNNAMVYSYFIKKETSCAVVIENEFKSILECGYRE